MPTDAIITIITITASAIVLTTAVIGALFIASGTTVTLEITRTAQKPSPYKTPEHNEEMNNQ